MRVAYRAPNSVIDTQDRKAILVAAGREIVNVKLKERGARRF